MVQKIMSKYDEIHNQLIFFFLQFEYDMSSSMPGDSLCELGQACAYLHVFILLSDFDSTVWCLSLIWENF